MVPTAMMKQARRRGRHRGDQVFWVGLMSCLLIGGADDAVMPPGVARYFGHNFLVRSIGQVAPSEPCNLQDAGKPGTTVAPTTETWGSLGPFADKAPKKKVTDGRK